MTRRLSEDERKLWERTTKTVRPLDNAPVSPVEGHQHIRVTAPRSQGFRPVLDLHGLTLHEAFQKSKDHIQTAVLLGQHRYVIIITGLSGQIHQEFPRWFTNHPQVRSINSLRGGGAWEIWLKRKDT